jgi:hypothetical protein
MSIALRGEASNKVVCAVHLNDIRMPSFHLETSKRIT